MDICLPHSLARPDIMGPLKASKESNSGSKSWQQSPVSADRIAAAHNAQMEATTAAMRADYDAKIAELMADLEGTRGEKEKTDTDMAILKASARKERLQWNKERTLLSRKVAEAEARAREAADGVASPQEFTTLQQALATGEATIQSLRKALEVEETRRDKLQFEVACALTAEADVERLMVLVASLEKNLAEERDAKKAAEQEAEARSADTRGLERRLAAAVEAAALAEDSAAKCIEDGGKITAEVHDARASQRYAELWLEKSLAEVDAVHAVLAHERSVAAGTAANVSMQAAHHHFDRSMQTPLLQPPPSPASDGVDSHAAFAGMRTEMVTEEVREVREGHLGTGVQTPIPDSPTSMLAVLGATPSAGGMNGYAVDTSAAAAAAAHATPTSHGSQGSRSGLRTPDQIATRPVLYSATRLRTRMGGAGRGMGMDGDDEVPPTAATRGEGEGGGGGRGGVGVFSPPTPTVLFGELASDGGSTAWEKEDTTLGGVEGAPRRPADGNATSEAVVAHTRVLVGGGAGNGAYCHGGKAAPEKPGKAMTTTTTTTSTTMKKNDEVGVGGGVGEENTMAALLSLLRLETSKREEVQARATELEGAIAVVAQEAAAAVTRAESLAPAPHRQRQEEQAATPSPDGGSEACPCIHLHGSGATANGGGGGGGRTRQQTGVRGTAAHPENLSSDPHATFVRLDQDRQVAKILGLVREARTKLKVATGSAGCGVGAAVGGGGRGRGETRGKAARAGRGGSFPSDETEINAWNGLNPTIEVASLIEQLEGELKRSADDNSQLREFCTHLEGLLAARADSIDEGGGGGVGGGRGGGTVYAASSASVAVGGGCNGWDANTAVGGNHPTGDANPFAVQRGSFGERRKGAPLPGRFQDLC